ncbi:MAG TPA: hypothetical protein VGK58_12175, partial [Lacipirellulaceae bacterium]
MHTQTGRLFIILALVAAGVIFNQESSRGQTAQQADNVLGQSKVVRPEAQAQDSQRSDGHRSRDRGRRSGRRRRPSSRRSERVRMEQIEVASPSGRIRIVLLPNAERLAYMVKMGDVTVIEPSTLRMTVDGFDLPSGVVLGKVET